MTSPRCADLSCAAGEELAGTGIVATRWLCVESTVPWGRDAVETGFPPAVAAHLAALDAEVLAMRRPGRRPHLTVFAGTTAEGGSTLRRLELDELEALLALDPWASGEPVHDVLLLVCTHGRRDACCSRLGIPVYHALDALAGPELVWQCSHTGGHRFAANVVALPHGVTLGRVEPGLAPEVVTLLRAGRVPLDAYRGRSAYTAQVQAAEVAVRRARGLDVLDDLRFVGPGALGPTFALADGSEVATAVEELAGPEVVKSCSADPEPTTVYRVRLA